MLKVKNQVKKKIKPLEKKQTLLITNNILSINSLELNDFKIHITTDFEKGLKALRQTPFHLILALNPTEEEKEKLNRFSLTLPIICPPSLPLEQKKHLIINTLNTYQTLESRLNTFLENDNPYTKINGLHFQLSDQLLNKYFFAFKNTKGIYLDFIIGHTPSYGILKKIKHLKIKHDLQEILKTPFPHYSFENRWEAIKLEFKELLSKIKNYCKKENIQFTYGRFDFETKKLIYFSKICSNALHLKGNTSFMIKNNEKIPIAKKETFFFPLETTLSDENLLHILKKKQNLIRPSNFLKISISEQAFFPSNRVLSVQFQSDIKELKKVRNFIALTCKKAFFPIQYTQEVQLAINEIFCNICKHGYEGKNDKIIKIKLKIFDDKIIFLIADKGKSFDPALAFEPIITKEKENGFGWFIIQKLVDKIHYYPKTQDNEWNILKFEKRKDIMKKMKIHHHIDQDALIITPEIEFLDADVIKEFKEQVFKIISETKTAKVILNLQNIKFIDSSGLGCLLSILRKVNEEKGDLKLSHLNKSVLSIIELVSLHKVFEIYQTPHEALKAFNP